MEADHEHKKRLAALTVLAILLICLSACQAAEQEGFEPEAEKHSSYSSAYIVEPKGEDEAVVSQTDTGKTSGVFDFENGTVLLNSGYEMPILGLGTYALNHDTCVNSVMTLLKNGGRLIDTVSTKGYIIADTVSVKER